MDRIEFRALFQAAAGLCLAVLPDGPQYTIVAVSDAYASARMTPREQLLGRGLAEALAAYPANDLAASLQRVVAERVADTMSVQKLENRWWSPTNRPVLGPDGELLYIIHAIEDVTEDRERERIGTELRDANAFLDAIIENIPLMLFIKESESLRFVRFNRAGEALLGWPRQALVGKSDFDFWPRDQAEHFVARDRETMNGGKVLDIPYEPIQTRERGLRTLHTKKVPILDAAGSPLYLLGISEDITERTQLEDERRLIADASIVLSASLDYEETLSAVTQLAVQRVSDWCSVDVAEESGLLKRLKVASGDPADAALCAELERLPANRQLPYLARRVFETEQPVVIEQVTQEHIEAVAQESEHMAALLATGITSFIAVPLMLRGKALGVMLFGSKNNRRVFRQGDLRWAEALADRAAVAIENARLYRDSVQASLLRERLYSAEKLARAAAEASQRRSAFLADCDTLLASLDSHATLAAVAAMAVPRIADWCVVKLEEERQRGLLPVIAHVDPSKVPFVLELSRQVRAEGSGDTGIAYVTRTGESLLYPSVSSDQDLDALFSKTGVVSSMVVPIVARGATLGAIVLNSADPDRHYDQHDLAMAEDLGRKVGLALENARLFREVRDADRRKEEFLAMLSHELRNPLGPIVTAVDLMGLQDDHAFAPEREMIQRNVRHLVRMVDDLLDVARINTNKIQLTKTRLEAREVLADAVEIAKHVVDGGEHHLRVSTSSQTLPVLGDRVRLAQALGNLVTNAAKYTERGGKIDLSATEEGDFVVFRVRDSGIGMSRELLPSVFDLFVQGSTTLERSQGGLGIGLTIVKGIVTMHGGTVTAHSEGPGRGSELAIRLPRAEGVSSSAASLPDAHSVRRGLRILVVDDNHDIAVSFKFLLEKIGCTPLVVHDGAAALAAAPTFRPELALLDLGLPVMDGYELARRLRDLDGTLRIVAVTGYGQDSDRARSKAAGFDEHLVKPIALSALRRVLATA